MSSRRWFSDAPLVAGLTMSTGAFLLVVQLVCLRAGVHVGQVTRDVAALVHQPWYVGVLSNFGLGVWGAAIGAAVVGWAVARRHPAGREAALALAGLAVLSAILATDDNLQVHELLVPEYLHLPDKAVYATYFLLAAAWGLRFRNLLLARVPLPLAVAAVSFAASIVADHIGDAELVSVPYVVEDGAKLVGQLNWALVAFLLARDAVADVSVAAGRNMGAPHDARRVI